MYDQDKNSRALRHGLKSPLSKSQLQHPSCKERAGAAEQVYFPAAEAAVSAEGDAAHDTVPQPERLVLGRGQPGGQWVRRQMPRSIYEGPELHGECTLGAG